MRARFPELIDPKCPLQDIRALTHEVLPGVKVTCTMEGDSFEMEDHRNWNDASYKTYIRPLAKPWPYTVAAGETTQQSVTLAFEGSVAQAAADAGGGPIKVTLGDVAGTMPAIGLSLRPEHADGSLEVLDLIERLGPQFLVCPFIRESPRATRPRRGRGARPSRSTPGSRSAARSWRSTARWAR